LWEQVCTYAREHSKPEKQAGRAWHLFKDIVGKEPSKDWSLGSTPDVVISANVLSKIRSMNIRHARGRK
jgi:hypothetical protein